MTPMDRFLQAWRMAEAHAWVDAGATVLDIGTADGTLFRRWRVRGVGIDPDADESLSTADVRLVRGTFPDALPATMDPLDAATALAVLEHLDESELRIWENSLHDLLRPGGRFVATVPHPFVDQILHVLMALRVIDGMHTHEHHGFQVAAVRETFGEPRWRLVNQRRFQLGLNNVFVLERR